MRSQQIMPLLALALASALLAALVATLLLTIPTLAQIEEPWNIVVVSEALTFARLTFIVALAHALILGLPLFFFLRSRHRLGIASCVLAGFLVGAVPFGVLDLISMFGVQSASTGGTPTIINGVSTLAGWIEYAYAVSFTGLFGLAGGVTFWVVMRVFGQLAGEPNGTDAQPSKVRRGSWSIVSVAVVLTCAVFLLPSIVRDGSCHNLFRDGRTSIGPQIGADISLPAEDWPTLTQIFVDFGRTHSISFRRDEQIRRGTLMWRDLNLCSEAGVNIDAVEQPGLAQMKSRIADRGIDITVYELKPGSDWKPLARDLINRIDTTWPQKITFRGPDGRVISVEEALKGRQ
jgi:hypothetical protein